MAESVDIRELNVRIEQQSGFVTNLSMGMNKVIVGQKHLIDMLLISLLSDGHILLEGVPGLGILGELQIHGFFEGYSEW